MPGTPRNSNCSAGVRVDYYWWACASDRQADHVSDAVDALFEAISGPRRRWNPWATTLVRTGFRRRIEKATTGTLVPVKEVKPLGDGRAALFEIRWPDIAVTEVGADGELRHGEVEVRLIHAEPVEHGLSAIGLRAHEKLVDPDDDDATHADQDRQIETAIALYYGAVAPTLGDRGRLRS